WTTHNRCATSPRKRAVCGGERAGWPVGVERDAHDVAGALLDRFDALEVIQRGRGEAGTEAAELLLDAFGSSGDRGRVGDVELEGVSSGADALCGCLTLHRIARSDQHGVAVLGELLGDLRPMP